MLDDIQEVDVELTALTLSGWIFGRLVQVLGIHTARDGCQDRLGYKIIYSCGYL